LFFSSLSSLLSESAPACNEARGWDYDGARDEKEREWKQPVVDSDGDAQREKERAIDSGFRM